MSVPPPRPCAPSDRLDGLEAALARFRVAAAFLEVAVMDKPSAVPHFRELLDVHADRFIDAARAFLDAA